MSTSELLTAPTILVPVDFDQASRQAVASAVALARILCGRVVVLHVTPPNWFPEGTRVLPLTAADPVDISTYVSERAREMLREHFAAALVGGVEVRIEARCGRPAETILKAINACDAKLVIVGTHGRTGFDRFVLGSVAETLIRSSPVPVMIHREREPEVREHDRSYVGAAAVSGAIAGAATGALAGPPGALAGGAIGTVIGTIAGAIIDRESVNEDAHDRELDDTIGVTQGSLGTPPETKLLASALANDPVAERRARVG